MKPFTHTPKHLRQYPYAPRLETPVVLKDPKGILGDLYGNTYKGPYVRVTHKEAFEARVTKRVAAGQPEPARRSMKRQSWPVYADGSPIVTELGESEAKRAAKALEVQEASIDTIESLDTDTAEMTGRVRARR